ncbi:alpha/beta fold hydrolase [Paenibacillus validus]|uniref:alpha/beta fold hydrolase n=1 Tax=Paenibacillus validus TaxID=44253 RepID=UPI000FDA4CF0|nr:alpha/beta hydrolase [Paenibacillus validus]MED4601692.1 alpha/beta fold hydrolase [Paenibacillus validus]MED4606197.1 alpha/beta fold hydrolase [Paenibacillus validus]
MALLATSYRMSYEFTPNPDPDAKTIVLLHGLGLSGSFWRSLIPLLSVRYSLLVCDLPGHGLSGETSEDVTFATLAEDLRLLLESLNVSSVVLVAHDASVYIARRLAALTPSSVERMIYISPYMPHTLPATLTELQDRRLLLEQAPMTVYAAAMAHKLTGTPGDALLHQRIVQAHERVSKALYIQLLDLAGSEQALHEQAHVRKPLMIISGELDASFPPGMAHIAHMLFDASAFLIVPGASNLTFVDQPLYTSDFIDRFVRKTPFEPGKPKPVEDELKQTLRVLWSGRLPSAPERNRLTIRCIGTFEVSLGQRPIRLGWNTRHAKSILMYLAYHRSATREQLCETLFPETAFPKAMRNLRVYLNHFSKLLETEDGQEPCLTIERDTIKLNIEIDCDLFVLLRELQSASEQADSAYKLNQCVTLSEQLQSKILSGCFDPFSIALKETVEQAWEQLSLWAADNCCEREQYAEAVRFLQSGLQYGTGEELLFYDRLIAISQRTGNAKELRKWMRMRKKACVPT